MKLFIDLETTGLPKTKSFNNWYNYTELDKYESSRIIEIGIVVTKNDGDTLIEYSSLVKPNNFTNLTQTVKGLTKLSDIDINSQGKSIRKVFDILKKYLVDIDTIIAYNIGFDINVLLSELHRINDTEMIDMINNIKHDCVMNLSKEVLNLGKCSKLCNVYKKLFNNTINQEHRALSDTRICKDVYFELKNRKPTNYMRNIPYYHKYDNGCTYIEEDGDPFDPLNADNWDGDQQVGFRSPRSR